MTVIQKSADEVDMASELEIMFTEGAVAAVVCKLAAQHDDSFNGVGCVECDDPLPVLRLQMGRIRCVDCQTVLENRGKFYI